MNSTMKIIFFDNSVKKLIRNLEKPTASKVFRMIDLLERYGFGLKMPHSRRIDKNLYELRIRGRQEVRIFYAFHNDAILLHGFVKKTGKTPERELEVVRRKLECIDRR